VRHEILPRLQAREQDVKRFQSESYRRWVASLPCIECGVEGLSQCAHENGGGMGTKTSDLRTFPLCCDRPGVQGCHSKFDQCVGMTKEHRRELTDFYVICTRTDAAQAGRTEGL
jgi:hypothetical protein